MADHPGAESPETVVARLEARLGSLGKPVISKANCARLTEVECAEMEARGLEDFKLKTNEAMLAAMGGGAALFAL